MIWRRSTPKPSAEATEQLARGTEELQEVRALRVESQRVGAQLTAAHRRNHIALSLERAIAGGRT